MGVSTWLVVGCLLLTVALAGCVAAINSAKMVPVIDYTAFNKGGKTLAIAPVTSKAEEIGFNAQLLITEVTYQGVLSESIKRSGIFAEVSFGQSADFLLNVEILSQKLIPGLTANAVFFVRYELTDTRTRERIWQDSILSQYDSYGGDLQNLVEGSARANITQFLTALNALPSVR